MAITLLHFAFITKYVAHLVAKPTLPYGSNNSILKRCATRTLFPGTVTYTPTLNIVYIHSVAVINGLSSTEHIQVHSRPPFKISNMLKICILGLSPSAMVIKAGE